MLERRRVLRMALAGLAGASLPRPLRAAASVPLGADDWLESIARKEFRAFLDIRSFAPDGAPFQKAANLLRALVEAHGAQPDQVGIAFGAGSSSIAHVLGPKIWVEYGVGRKVAGYARTPAEAASLQGEPEKWAATGGQAVATMRAAGIRVLACRNSIGRWARELAAESGETPESVNAKLIAGLHEGVEPVPAMIAAAVLAQRSDLSYVAIG